MAIKILAAITTGMLIAQSAVALPILQLDIDGGTYLGGSEESTVTDTSSFSLWALGKTSEIDLSVDYYLSVALLPATTDHVTDIANFGEVMINGTKLSSFASTFEYGQPPIESIDGELAPHGVFDTIYYELAFKFDTLGNVSAYNVADDSAAPGELYREIFDIDASALNTGYGLHFDLYTYGDSKGDKIRVTDFAPFSHDAAYCIGLDCEPHEVTEPSTLALLGLGLISILGIRRRSST
ncbi:hypothetical protein C7H09_03860 [Marinobacter fuscus]|uniref:Ice-binding protein C-terminal domain-containing protein n=1 Tax=Marinobacter fuscus TaxID=2109942 RepID=A0A2T1KRP9_9GAMM|nr:choice-of-anchor N protein [Marinobacter fuscus]PSF12353.1 hypothetical protein C7H09_03860 [Marinobacter fuscus]